MAEANMMIDIARSGTVDNPLFEEVDLQYHNYYSHAKGRQDKVILYGKTIAENLIRWGLVEKHPNSDPAVYRLSAEGDLYFRSGPR